MTRFARQLVEAWANRPHTHGHKFNNTPQQGTVKHRKLDENPNGNTGDKKMMERHDRSSPENLVLMNWREELPDELRNSNALRPGTGSPNLKLVCSFILFVWVKQMLIFIDLF